MPYTLFVKRRLTRGEKWLWAAPLLFGVAATGVTFGPRAVRRAVGAPNSLFTAPGNYLRSMALSQNGEVLAAGGAILDRKGWKPGSGRVYLWDARTAQQLLTIAPVYTRNSRGGTVGFDIYGLTLSTDGKQIGFNRGEKKWVLYDSATQRQLWQYPAFISHAEYSNDGRYIALSDDQNVAIVHATDGRVRNQWKRAGPTYSQHIDWSPDGMLVACIGPQTAEAPVEVRRSVDGALIRRINCRKATGVSFSPDGERIVVASTLGSTTSSLDSSDFVVVSCWSVSTGNAMWEVKSQALLKSGQQHASCSDAIFSPDGRLVAACEYMGNQVFILDSLTGAVKSVRNMGGHGGIYYVVPTALVFSPDGKRLFARDRDSVLYWDLH